MSSPDRTTDTAPPAGTSIDSVVPTSSHATGTGAWKTYAEPWSTTAPMSSPSAPTASVTPSIATAEPKRSLTAASEATTFAVSVPLAHPPAGCSNTYTEPWSPVGVSSPFAPTTTVSPLIPTVAAKKSGMNGPPASEAVSLAVNALVVAQPPPGLTNTYAAPGSPGKKTSLLAPTTTVPPSIATDVPKVSFCAPSEAVSFAVWVPLVQPPAGFSNT